MNAPTKIHLDLTINDPANALGEIAEALKNKLDAIAGKRLPDGVNRIDGTDMLYTFTKSVTHYEAPEAVAKLEQVPGYTPWEMAMPHEATRLVHYGKYNPAVDIEKHPGIKSERAWISKDPCASSSGFAWGVDFGNGNVDCGGRVNHCRALAVCRPVPASQE
ncbi:DUF1566 domain-containing protein [Dyella caseinilytica]|uniref:DUF1566 domain-containing protein n=1 Tax=Dyella caseinilytica TaxID=1849581 RepID=A0ABX7GY42_9GAMM|nr:DUF1566 domain-containing protein [Dyella caseinilytica]QRN55214.1 DUF1566 domain-containing protein [Dyella caseinilytica]GGA00158.1 hypothetical protein GCM10011408_21270 [Dyella caseinilytica]